ncbi:MAG: VWA domain-containing protein, partial [Acidobacteriota bacterium]|nr:VWA domain-containing protein [Acidobacteriota bacterium]
KAPLGQPIRTRAENAGRVLTFVVDDGNCFASRTGMLASRQALEKFVTEQMRPDDLVAIYQTRSGSSVLQQFTSDKAQLMRVVRKIRWYPPAGMCSNDATGDFFDPARLTTFNKDRDTPVVNTESEMDRANRNKIENRARDNQVAGLIGVLRYITRGLQRVSGRKTVFLLSDGIPLLATESELRGPTSAPVASMRIADTGGVMRDLIDSANRASVVFNTIDVRGVLPPDGGITAQDAFRGLSGRDGNIHATANITATRTSAIANSQSGMVYLADETGGRFYDDANDLNVPMRRALNLEKGYYLIGYQPDADTFKGKRFNKIEIKVKRPDLSVRSRSGFFGITDESLRPKKRAGDSELYDAIAAPLPNAGLNLHLTAFFANTVEEGSFVRTLLHLDGQQISFANEPSGMKGVFDVVAVTLNEKNEVVDEFNKTHTIRFPAAHLSAIKQNGLIYTADIPVKKPGAYNFRVAIRDVTSKLLGSAGQQIEVPDLKKNSLVLSGLTIGEVELQNGKPVIPSIEKAQDGFAPVARISNPAIRRFRPGAILGYSYKLYGAERATQQARLTVQVRLYREGQVVTEGAPQAPQFEPQADMMRISDYGYLRLQPDTLAGDYALQILIKDLKSNETTSQWIDFEVVR